jgi:hypothetical protein
MLEKRTLPVGGDVNVQVLNDNAASHQSSRRAPVLDAKQIEDPLVMN